MSKRRSRQRPAIEPRRSSSHQAYSAAFDRRSLAVIAVLAGLTVATFASVATFGFVRFDDPTYVTENPRVLEGLTREGVWWAFTTGHSSNWHPLTWLSHMLDVQLFGPGPGPQHVTNLVLHALNTILVFLVLGRMTRSMTRSAFVAALFAIHPLHVESVTWISERKDVLSTLFWLLTMMAYVAYVEAPRARRYALVVGLFVCGLLSKPMVVTLPFALLLLDVWPLRRADAARALDDAQRRRYRSIIAALVREKLPLIGLALASSVVTVLVQRRGGAVGSFASYPLASRLANAVVSYAAYIGNAIWPRDLAVFYPYPIRIDVAKVAVALLVLTVVSAVAIRNLRRRPYLLVGWLWYLGTLLPVIGVVQVGLQSRADRYTYVPLIGILIMVVWGLADLAERFPARRIELSIAGASVVLAYAAVARRQAETWRDSLSLWRHAVDVTSDNDVAHYNLGVVLTKAGRADEGIVQMREAVRINPTNSDAHIDLGNALAERGDTDAAIAEFATVVRLRPDYAEARTAYGKLLAARGRTRDAIAEFREAIRLQPNLASPHNELGNALASDGQLGEALAEYREAARLAPEFAEAHNNLGAIYARQGNTDDAIREFLEALRLKPGDVTFHYNAALMLEKQQRVPEAIQHLETVLKLNPTFQPARAALERLRPSGGSP